MTITTKTTADIIKKIQALRARAVDSASTEAEAAIAARVAQSLLEEHNITLTEVDVRAEGIEKGRWDSGQNQRPVAAWAIRGINKACGVRGWYSGGIVTIVGAPADVEVALYYLDLVTNAAYACWTSFQRSDAFYSIRERGVSVRTIGTDFRQGVVSRLGERIAALAPSAPAAASSGTSLVVVKDQLINEYLKKTGVRLSTSKSSRSVGSGYAAGRSAANGVALSKGIGSGRTSRLALA